MFKIPDLLAISVQQLPCGTHYALIKFFYLCGGGSRIVPGSIQVSANAARRFGRRHLVQSGRLFQAARRATLISGMKERPVKSSSLGTVHVQTND